MTFLIGGANTLDDGGYTIDNSLRMNDADNAYLSFTPGSDGDLDKWTLSMWVKRTTISTYDYTFTVKDDSDNNTVIVFYADDGVRFEHYDGSQLGMLTTNRKLNDPSAWYHIVFVWDTGNGTAGNRQRMYINGVEETSFATDTNPSSGRVSFVSDASYVHWIGRGQTQTEANNFDGYLAEVAFCDGQAYAASDFGETDDNGVWVPKKLGVTFGSQGYYLEFKETGTSANASGIGADTSGNGNHWAVTNLAATDITTDTPTNNFATLNSLVPPFSQTNYTLSEGNCKYVTGLNQPAGVSNMAMANGKWYWEIKKGSTVDNPAFGVVGSGYVGTFGGNSWADADSTVIQAKSTYIENGDRIGYSNNGSDVYKNGSAQSYGSFDAIASGDIFMVALDMDNLKIWFGNNGTWLGSGDPAGGSNHVATLTDSSFYLREEGSQLAAVDSPAGENVDWEINFGNPSFAISSGNSDDNGYGNFEYDVPTGFYALCTKNLAEFG